MGQLASCPQCGLSMQVLDLGIGGPPVCPTCAVAMEEVPDAEMVAEGPPQGPLPPLDATWRPVGRGLGLVTLALAVFFAGWGLVLIAGFADIVFRLVDQDRAVALFVFVLFAGSVLFAVVNVLLAFGRVSCCATVPGGPDRQLAQRSLAATVLGALVWLALAVWSALLLPETPPLGALVVFWLIGLVLLGISEVMFLRFIRTAARSLNDRTILEEVNWFFARRGRVFAAGLVVVVLAALLAGVVVGTAEEAPSLTVDVALVLLAVLLGVASTPLLAREVRAVGTAKQSIEERLTPAEGLKADEVPQPGGGSEPK
jgi:hypothetical protein